MDVESTTSSINPLTAPPGAGAYDAAAGLRFLLRTGLVFASSLDYELTLAAVAREAVPELADWCAVDVLDDAGRLRRVAVEHRDPALVALARELEARYPEDPAAPDGLYARMRARRTDWRPEITDDLLMAAARDPQHLRMLRALELRSYIAVPLVAHDDVLGVLSLVAAESGRRYSEPDVAVAEGLARQAALAIANARAHRDALDHAERLQQQQLELELQSQQLQDQAAEMETQQTELEMQTEELRHTNEELLAAHERLSEAERFVRSILESIADPFIVYDCDFRPTLVNSAARRVFSAVRVAEDFSGSSLWEQFPDLVGTAFEREMRAAARTREPRRFVEFRAAAGTWTEARCYPVGDDRLAVLWRDITTEKRAEEALHYLSSASEVLSSSLDYEATLAELARLVVPRLADWCSVDLVQPDGTLRQVTLVHADPGRVAWARELAARYPADPNGPGAPRVVRTGKPELYEEISDELLAASAVDDEHLTLLRQVGWASAMVVPLEARGRVLGALTLVASESRRRYGDADLSLARELARRAALAVDNARLYHDAVQARHVAERARADATHANEAKAAFLAQMSHELRTPLNAIGGYAELLEMQIRGPMTELQLTDVARIRRSQRHLLALITDILNYAKIEAGRVQYELRTVPVRDLLADLGMLVEPLLRERNQRYTVEPPSADVRVQVDAEKLQQILLNLVSNAIKFTPAGGQIAITAAATDEWVEIVVRDTGIGIPAEKLETIFEPFVQLRSSQVSAPSEGAGLGLAISRDLARGMGGDLIAESRPGDGSAFTVRLPRVSD